MRSNESCLCYRDKNSIWDSNFGQLVCWLGLLSCLASLLTEVAPDNGSSYKEAIIQSGNLQYLLYWSGLQSHLELWNAEVVIRLKSEQVWCSLRKNLSYVKIMWCSLRKAGAHLEFPFQNSNRNSFQLWMYRSKMPSLDRS